MNLEDRDKLPFRTVGLIVTGPNWTTTSRDSYASVYQKIDGSWWLDFHIRGILSATATAFTGAIAGITVFGNGTAMAASLTESGVENKAPKRSVLQGATGNFIVESLGTFDLIYVHGKVRLESEPNI